MTLLIRAEHRPHFQHLMSAMFRLRHQVFVEQLGWRLPPGDGVHEIDQFDAGDECLHLVTFGPSGKLAASTRITPSLAPNVSCDILQHSFDIQFPRAKHIVELSRTCVDPSLDVETRRRVIAEQQKAAYQVHAMNGWTQAIGVLSESGITRQIRYGMTLQILAGPVRFPGDSEMSFAATGPLEAGVQDERWRRLGAPDNALQDPKADASFLDIYSKLSAA